MKNYLFAPFKDDDDKIDTFNYLQSHLDNESLIMFMGRLESYYDKIISDLSNRCAVAVVDERIIKGLEDEIRELKAENKQLTQTIKYSNGNDGLYDEIVESNEHLEDQIKELKEDNKRLYQEHKECREDAVKHYPKEYKAEADEYFSHNPKGETLFFFIVGDDEIDEDGDVTRTLNVGCDSIAEIDNMEVN